MDYPVLPCGDRAVTVQIGTLICEPVHRQVMAALKALERAAIPGVTECVPTYTTICIHYDPCVIGYGQLLQSLASLELGERGETAPCGGRLVTLPVCYGGEYGPDLSHVAAHSGMTEDQVVARHTGGEYLVYMLGFLPGFAYMGGMDEAIACPRLTAPRTKIPAGSVGIAGSQTGIYPLASPGGWQLIGRTPLALFHMEAGQARFLLAAGDRVKFKAITPEEFQSLEVVS